MDICLAYEVLNEDLLRVARDMYPVEEVQEPEKEIQLRLKENALELSKETMRCCQVVSAHNLYQYKNKFHSIDLKENMKSWLDLLLMKNKGEEYDIT